MNTISTFTQRFPRRGLPFIVRSAKFDRGGFRKSKLNGDRYSSFHFASSEYAKCFRDLPEPNVKFLKEATVNFLDEFDKELWYQDPVREIGIVVTVVIASTMIIISWETSFQ